MTQDAAHAPQEFDALVIGSGQSGGPLATTMAESGRRVALVERAHVGGSCVNFGCTPTKTMIASARVAHLVRRSNDYGVHTGAAPAAMQVKMTAVRQRKRKMVESFRSGSQQSIEDAEGVTLIRGEARFADQADTAKGFLVEVVQDEQVVRRLRAAQIFINTGTRTRMPDLPGLSSINYLDNASIMELDHVPEHLLILGGGYIGLEFGQMFRRFGSHVTIVQRSEQLLSREDEDVAVAVAEILREDGIEVLLEAEAQRVSSGADGTIQLAVKLPEGLRTLTASHVLVATGRQPNSDRLRLEKVGVKTDKQGYIQTNKRLETNVPGIFVLGDVKGGPAFTHISYDDFRILRSNLLRGGNATTEARIIPYTVFIDPELGRVGLSEVEARQQGYKVQVAKLPMAQVARAMEMGETRGFMKAVVDGETQRILGCAILGVAGGEIATMIQIAMIGDLPHGALRDGVFSHPTLGESLNNLFSRLEE